MNVSAVKVLSPGWVAASMASLPEKLRGFGHVKMRNLAILKAEESALQEHFNAAPQPFLKAAE